VDNVYTLFSKSDQQDYDKTSYNALMADSTMQEVNFDDGNYIVGVVSSGCQYCRTSCLKMSEIVAHNHIDSSRVAYLIWGDSASIRLFPSETESTAFRFYKIQPLQAIRVTNGHFPTYLFLHNGEIVKSADLRHLTEKEVKSHLQ
jgi:hypothetical protein